MLSDARWQNKVFFYGDPAFLDPGTEYSPRPGSLAGSHSHQFKDILIGVVARVRCGAKATHLNQLKLNLNHYWIPLHLINCIIK